MRASRSQTLTAPGKLRLAHPPLPRPIATKVENHRLEDARLAVARGALSFAAGGCV
jgi:hypothetical protein